MPIASVVIPTYNGSKFLTQTIESVLNQSYKDFEIIVVDDGSTEDIEQLLKPYGEYLRYLRIENSGPAAARNTGIRLSNGEFVALLDHDDIWAPENLRVKVELLHKNPECAMVYSYPTLIDAIGNVIPQESPSAFPSGSVFEDFLISNRIITFSCTLIRKSIFDSVGLLDDRREITCCDDYDMWLRIADVSTIVFSTDQSVCYRIHGDNLINNHDMSLNSHMSVYNKILKESKTASKMPIKKLSRIAREHIYEKLRQYAYKFYYDRSNYKKTRELLWRCILLKPFAFRVWMYFLICSLPSVLVARLRSAKHLFSMNPKHSHPK
ncbi:MAG: glycosyltransferase [Desulfuromonadales bacterium]|nr:glycosyltransferase [Desulfuromonadales bacterium]